MIIGIDPGIHGAIAEMYANGNIIVWDMPIFSIKKGKKTHNFVDVVALADNLRINLKAIKHVYLEEINTVFPTQTGRKPSNISLLYLGRNFGNVEGVLGALRLPYSLLSPRKWKTYLSLGRDKNESLRRATQLYPEAANQWPLKKHDGRAEAVLIAHAGQRMAVTSLF